MKKIYTIIAAVLLTAIGLFPQQLKGQSPEKMSYQAIIRDASQNLIKNQAVGMQLSILQGSATGNIVYVETQAPTTNANGLISIEIGNGTLVSGNFNGIDWANGPYFIKTETDPNGGNAYSITGTSELLSVPYALFAKTADSLTTPESDPVYMTSIAAAINANDTSYWNNKIDSYTETDPLFTSSLAFAISQLDTTHWGTVYSWGNHNTAGYFKNGGEAKAANRSLGNTDNYSLYFKTNNFNRMVITNTGRVGIGYTNPQAPLHVNGRIYQSGLGFSTFIGYLAGANDNLSNNYNVFVGYKTGQNNTNGYDNSAIGVYALSHNTLGHFNNATGAYSLYKNTTGNYNTADGYYSLYNNTTGSYNTAFGEMALKLTTTGSYNTAIGRYAQTYATVANSTAIGNGAYVSASNKILLGNSSVTYIGGHSAWHNTSDARVKRNIKEDVVGLDFILNLRPVTYYFDKDKMDELNGIKDSSNYPEKYDINNIKQSGFLAQEVEIAANKVGYDFIGLSKPNGEVKTYSLAYAMFVIPLVKATQEQQKIINQQQKTIDEMKKEMAEIKAMLMEKK